MSLIYDALRSLPADDKAAPIHGSVIDSRVPVARRKRRVFGLGGGLVVVMLAGLLFSLGRQAERPAVSAEPETDVAQVATRPATPVVVAGVAAAADTAGQPGSGKQREAALVEPRRPGETAVEGAPLALTQVQRRGDAAPAKTSPAAAPRPVTMAVQKPASSATTKPEPQAAQVPVPPDAAPPRAAAPAATAPKSRSVSQQQAASAAGLPPPASANGAAAQAEEGSTPIVEHSALDVADSLRRFNAMVGRGEFVPAAELITELRKQGLNRLALSRMSAYLALRAQRLDEARRDYEQVLSLLPADREAGLNLAIIDARQGFPGQAEQRLRSLVELYPDDVQVRGMLTRIRAQVNAP